ncbi:uncharacterized protein AKAME5_002166100 [Lates japonicus]|uniref:Uncharacterized protein n=1 Tax=Lates japonicus TaxID=270547 RepID=A0AAD3NE13_LATJO|nr:uncharacterized protein AKAME5_002166100 [Lates japonicus]
MRWVPEQGELSCSVHYTTPVTARVSCSLYFSAAPGVAVVVVVVVVVVEVLPSEWAMAVGVLGSGSGLGDCHCYLPVHGAARRPADSQLLKVCLTEGLGSSSSSSLGTSQSLVSVLNFVARVGGG